MNEKDSQGHRERIKEKFLKNGIDGFAEYEILELLLTYCIPRKDTKPIAKELLNKFKSLDNVFKADFDKLSAIDGLGKNSIVFFKSFITKYFKIIPFLSCFKANNQNCV